MIKRPTVSAKGVNNNYLLILSNQNEYRSDLSTTVQKVTSFFLTEFLFSLNYHIFVHVKLVLVEY